MAPRHVTPCIALRVVLIEEVVGAVEHHEAVGVVGPVPGRRIVYLRPVRLAVVLLRVRTVGVGLFPAVDERIVLLAVVNVVAAADDGSRREDGHHALEYMLLFHFFSSDFIIYHLSFII